MRNSVFAGIAGAVLLAAAIGVLAQEALAQARRSHSDRPTVDCPPDSVRSGTVCIDKYEASVWVVHNAKGGLVGKIRAGTATLSELRAGAVQRGLVLGDLEPECPANGAGCTNAYAVSVKGVLPSAFINWFQAAAAARNAYKRLPTNQEWQAAALGTPDAEPCNVNSSTVASTGAAAECVSDVGAYDMVGNLLEWVADWVPASPVCGTWGIFSNAFQCLSGADTAGPPGALIRGGYYENGSRAGVFAVSGEIGPSDFGFSIGFRAVR